MARSEFLRNLTEARRHLAIPKGTRPAEREMEWAVWNQHLWLMPKTLKNYVSDDFTNLPADERRLLDRSVHDFLEIAQGPESGLNSKTITKARRLFDAIWGLVQKATVPDWVGDLHQLVGEIAAWARENDWDTKLATKTITESPLDPYEAPRLLIHTLDGKLLVDPIARFVAGAEGLVELSVIPSFDSLQIFLTGGRWRIERIGPSDITGALTKERFLRAANHLLNIAAHEPA